MFRPSLTGLATNAIGLPLTLLHLISIALTRTLVNPARFTAVVVSALVGRICPLWLCRLAPILGARMGGMLHGWLAGTRSPDIVGSP